MVNLRGFFTSFRQEPAIPAYSPRPRSSSEHDRNRAHSLVFKVFEGHIIKIHEGTNEHQRAINAVEKHTQPPIPENFRLHEARRSAHARRQLERASTPSISPSRISTLFTSAINSIRSLLSTLCGRLFGRVSS